YIDEQLELLEREAKNDSRMEIVADEQFIETNDKKSKSSVILLKEDGRAIIEEQFEERTKGMEFLNLFFNKQNNISKEKRKEISKILCEFYKKDLLWYFLNIVQYNTQKEISNVNSQNANCSTSNINTPSSLTTTPKIDLTEETMQQKSQQKSQQKKQNEKENNNILTESELNDIVNNTFKYLKEEKKKKSSASSSLAGQVFLFEMAGEVNEGLILFQVFAICGDIGFAGSMNAEIVPFTSCLGKFIDGCDGVF
ncbi:MAG TPA: hypothetical protein PLZ45_11330, partial [Ferruginibacter sp.]|nr:hypothetical protein [Ferruginibacter sp.]